MDNSRNSCRPSPFHGASRRGEIRHIGIICATLLVCVAAVLGLNVSLHAAPTDAVITNCANDSQLRNAISTATGAVTITFNCGAATLPFTNFIEIQNNTQITIDGAGAITFDGANVSAFFQVFIQGDLTLRNLTVRRGVFAAAHPLEVFGKLTLENVKVENNTVQENGAGVYVNGNATVVISNSVFSLNTALQPASASRGGAIYTEGTLEVTNSSFDSNIASGGAGGAAAGGAIAVGGGATRVISSTFDTNRVLTTSGVGGAIANLGGSVEISGTIFRANKAPDGGALSLTTGTQMTVTNSQLEANVARYGGGVESSGELQVDYTRFISNSATDGTGGAIWVLNSDADVTYSTFSNNTASLSGGAIRCDANTLSVINSTFDGNKSGASGGAISSICNLNMSNSTLSGNEAVQGGGAIHQAGSNVSGTVGAATIANNKAAFGAGVYNDALGASPSTLTLQMSMLTNNATGNCDGVVDSFGYNLSSDTNCASFTEPGDAQSQTLPLGPLANNGGPTLTRLPLTGSPAINRVPAADCPFSTDQRDWSRPFGGTCDVGALEATPQLYLPAIRRQ